MGRGGKIIGGAVLGGLALRSSSKKAQAEREGQEPHTDTEAPRADRGRSAASPTDIPASGVRDIVLRVKRELADDNVSFVAAGVAFFAFLSIFPAIAAIIAIYGLVSDPADVNQQMMSFATALPRDARELIAAQLKHLTSQPAGALGFGAVFAILLAVWSANKGTSGLVQGLNIVYGEKEHRGFIKLNAMTMLLTFAGILLVICAAVMVIVVPAALERLHLPLETEVLVSVLRWPLLAAMLLVSLAVVYRYGPSRQVPKWRWVSWGSGVATALFILGSLGFSFYVSHFGKGLGETYGSVAAVVILLMWLNLASYVVLLGGEINSEMERQTAKDTTAGPPKPLGKRGAFSADTVGETP